MNMHNPLHYIAVNKPTETTNLLAAYGLPAPQSQDELCDAVDYASEQNSQFIADLTALHPDKEVILNNYSNVVEQTEVTPTPQPIIISQKSDDALRIHEANQVMLFALIGLALIYIGIKIKR